MSQEQSGQRIEKQVSVGEWFNPLGNYFETPDDINRAVYRAKVFPFTVIYLGKFNLEIMWDDEADYQDSKGVVVLPFGENEIRIEDIRNQERKIEARLLEVGAVSDEERYENVNIPYQVELLLPSGTAFAIPFSNDEDSLSPPSTGLGQWRQLGSDEEGFLLIPEVYNILSSIKFRIAPNSQQRTVEF